MTSIQPSLWREPGYRPSATPAPLAKRRPPRVLANRQRPGPPNAGHVSSTRYQALPALSSVPFSTLEEPLPSASGRASCGRIHRAYGETCAGANLSAAVLEPEAAFVEIGQVVLDQHDVIGPEVLPSISRRDARALRVEPGRVQRRRRP